MEDRHQYPEETLGWNAIDDALQGVYGDQKPMHYGTVVGYRLGGPDPLDGISVYQCKEPVPHWHFVTYGFSELAGKTSDDPLISGCGFELTFRLAPDPDEEAPPVWALNFLQNMARYVFSTGRAFGHGHHINLRGPIAVNRDTKIRAIVFAVDPELGEIDTPNGHLVFLQVVGITLEEEMSIKAWNARGFLEIMEQTVPLLITNLERASLLESPAVAEVLQERALVEGSSTGSTHTPEANWRVTKGLLRRAGVRITLGALTIPDVKLVLPGRISHNREYVILSDGKPIVFQPAQSPGWSAEADHLAVRLTPELAKELSNRLEPKAGTYSIAGVEGLTIEVVKSEIKNAAGKVVDVLG